MQNSNIENIIASIDQSVARRGIYFWGEFKVVLTDNYLDIYRSSLFREKPKKVPLRDILFIDQKRKFDGLSSFFCGLITFINILILAILIQIVFIGIHEGGGPHMLVFIFSGFYFWIFVFIRYFFINRLIITTVHDQIAVNVYFTPRDVLNKFTNVVLKQKMFIKRQSAL